MPADQRGRIVELSRIGDDGRLALSDEPTSRYPGTRPHPYFSAAGGLYSTASDYLVFARMLLAHGRVGERQYVPAALVDEMFRDQLAPMGLERLTSTKSRGVASAWGCGYCSIRPPKAARVRPGRSAGRAPRRPPS